MITTPWLPDPACRAWYRTLVESRKTDADHARDQLRFFQRYSRGIRLHRDPSSFGDLRRSMGGIA